MKLLVDLGRACERFHNETVVGVRSKRLQCDGVWAFVYKKEKNASADLKVQGKAGNVWTWTALDADSKLMVSWLLGNRDAGYAHALVSDLASRLQAPLRMPPLTCAQAGQYDDARSGSN